MDPYDAAQNYKRLTKYMNNAAAFARNVEGPTGVRILSVLGTLDELSRSFYLDWRGAWLVEDPKRLRFQQNSAIDALREIMKAVPKIIDIYHRKKNDYEMRMEKTPKAIPVPSNEEVANRSNPAILQKRLSIRTPLAPNGLTSSDDVKEEPIEVKEEPFDEPIVDAFCPTAGTSRKIRSDEVGILNGELIGRTLLDGEPSGSRNEPSRPFVYGMSAGLVKMIARSNEDIAGTFATQENPEDDAANEETAVSNEQTMPLFSGALLEPKEEPVDFLEYDVKEEPLESTEHSLLLNDVKEEDHDPVHDFGVIDWNESRAPQQQLPTRQDKHAKQVLKRTSTSVKAAVYTPFGKRVRRKNERYYGEEEASTSNMDTKDKTFCYRCGYHVHHMAQHLRRVHREKPYKCKTCPASFTLIRQLQYHLVKEGHEQYIDN